MSWFLDYVGNIAWEVENAWHFLGRPIPIAYHEQGSMLLKVSGLFPLFDSDMGHSGAAVVLSPGVTLNEIATRLPRGGLLTRAWDDITVSGVIPEGSACYGPRRLRPFYTWERLEYGTDRWKEFLERGGEVDQTWMKRQLIDLSRNGGPHET